MAKLWKFACLAGFGNYTIFVFRAWKSLCHPESNSCHINRGRISISDQMRHFKNNFNCIFHYGVSTMKLRIRNCCPLLSPSKFKINGTMSWWGCTLPAILFVLLMEEAKDMQVDLRKRKTPHYEGWAVTFHIWCRCGPVDARKDEGTGPPDLVPFS